MGCEKDGGQAKSVRSNEGPREGRNGIGRIARDTYILPVSYQLGGWHQSDSTCEKFDLKALNNVHLFQGWAK